MAHSPCGRSDQGVMMPIGVRTPRRMTVLSIGLSVPSLAASGGLNLLLRKGWICSDKKL
jgi:hypothetical protein